MLKESLRSPRSLPSGSGAVVIRGKGFGKGRRKKAEKKLKRKKTFSVLEARI